MDPELKELTRLTAEEFIGLCNRFLKMTITELLEVTTVGRDPVSGKELPNLKSNMLEMLVASIIRKALVEGDEKRLNFLLDRMVGKIVQPLEHMGSINLEEREVIEVSFSWGNETNQGQIQNTDPATGKT